MSSVSKSLKYGSADQYIKLTSLQAPAASEDEMESDITDMDEMRPDRLGNLDDILYLPPVSRTDSPALNRRDEREQLLRKEQAMDYKKKMGKKKTMVTLAKSIFGIVILVQASGFRDSGYILGCIISLCTGTMSLYSALLLLHMKEFMVRAGRSRKECDYAELGQDILGWPARVAINFSSAANNFGCGAMYILFVSENVHTALQYFGIKVSIQQLQVMEMMVLVPLMLLRKLKYFAFTNLLGSFMTVVVLGYVYLFEGATLATTGPASDLQMFKWNTFAVFLGTSISALEGFMPLCLPIQNAMRKPYVYRKYVIISLGVSIFIFMSFGLMGYLTFGAATKDIIVLNLPPGRQAIGVQLGYSFCILFTYPPIVYVSIKIVEEACFGTKRHASSRLWLGRISFPCGLRTWGKNVVRMCIVLGTWMLAYLTGERLGILASLLGSVCCLPLGMIYPFLFYLFTQPRGFGYNVHIVLLIIGFSAMMLCWYQTYLVIITPLPSTTAAPATSS